MDKNFIKVLDQFASASAVSFSDALTAVALANYQSDALKNGAKAKSFIAWRMLVATAFDTPKTHSDSVYQQQVKTKMTAVF